MPRPDRHSGGVVRCAIYTRKSSDEGLEQEFNSLDAQREDCEAYIVSQRHAGWSAVPELYDDGGLSGGTMERPALQRLLAAIRAGKVKIIVVYKVDRLTRSLADFAKIVEILDAHSASFVSVTQQFNTTTSMGRLTLNMLLSFAQFEREIAGERIRDKIAASKARGMWMGGNVPLGYDVNDRKLVVNEAEAETVRLIFRRYAELGSVRLLRDELDRLGIVSKRREGAGGALSGGRRFSRGALYTLLQNRTYRGEIVHKGTAHPGQHAAVVDDELWESVEAKLSASRQERSLGLGAKSPSLLTGLIQDADGRRLTPTHANKAGKRYRYYVAERQVATDGSLTGPPARRLPAGEVEGLVLDRLRAFLGSQTEVAEAMSPMGLDAQTQQTALDRSSKLAARWTTLGSAELRQVVVDLIEKVIIENDRILLRMNRAALAAPAADALASGAPSGPDASPVVLPVEACLRRPGRGMRLIIGDAAAGRVDPALAALLREAFAARQELLSGSHDSIESMAQVVGAPRGYLSSLVRLSYLSPQIVVAISDGHQPIALTRSRLLALSQDLPLDWRDQGRYLGLPLA